MRQAHSVGGGGYIGRAYAVQGLADEPALVNCRLMKETTPWLFRQHCKSENSVRLAIPALDDYEKPKKYKKHIYKKNIHKKKHTLLEKKKNLKEKLYWKIHHLEKKLYTELRECKTYKCKLIVKSKLAKVYTEPAYSSILASAPSTFSGTTNAISGTTSSLGSTVGNTVSGTTNTLGGLPNQRAEWFQALSTPLEVPHNQQVESFQALPTPLVDC